MRRSKAADNLFSNGRYDNNGNNNANENSDSSNRQIDDNDDNAMNDNNAINCMSIDSKSNGKAATMLRAAARKASPT